MNIHKIRERAVLDAILQRLTDPSSPRPDSTAESERPDFIIAVAGETIGVEITLAAYEEHIRALRLQANECATLWINTTHFGSRPLRRSNEQLADSMGYNAVLQPWKPVGTSLFHWSQKIEQALESKRQKLNQEDFQKFDKNWLIVCDFPRLPADYEVRNREQHLLNLFEQQTAYAQDFDTVFVDSGDDLFCWHEGEFLGRLLPTHTNCRIN